MYNVLEEFKENVLTKSLSGSRNATKTTNGKSNRGLTPDEGSIQVRHVKGNMGPTADCRPGTLHPGRVVREIPRSNCVSETTVFHDFIYRIVQYGYKD